MGFVSLSSFFPADTVMHASSENCNNVVLAGSNNIDSAVATLSTLFVWFMLMPFIYEIGKIIAPGFKEELEDFNSEILRIHDSEDIRSYYAQEAEKKHETKSWYHRDDPMPLLKWTSVLAPDLWVAILSRRWTRRVIHDTPDFCKLEEEDAHEEAQDILRHDGSDSTATTTNNNSKKERELHEINKIDKVDEIESGKKEEKGGDDVPPPPPAALESRMTTHEAEQTLIAHDEEGFITSSLRDSDEAERKRWCERQQHLLPNYFDLCKMEYNCYGKDKPHLGWIVQSIFVILGIGHFMTPIGKEALELIRIKYARFLQVSIGYWNESSEKAYRFKEHMDRTSTVANSMRITKAKTLFPKGKPFRTSLPVQYVNVQYRGYV